MDQTVGHRMQALPGYFPPASQALSEWAEMVLQLESEAVQAIDEALNPSEVLSLVIAAFDQAFGVNNLGRFPTLRQRLVSRELANKVQQVIADTKAQVRVAQDVALRDLYNSAATSDVVAPLKSIVRNYLIVNIIKLIKRQPLGPLTSFQLVEDPETAALRTSLHAQRDRLFSAIEYLREPGFGEDPASPAAPPQPTSPLAAVAAAELAPWRDAFPTYSSAPHGDQEQAEHSDTDSL